MEEHQGDRFRTFINQRLFDGNQALTSGDVLWINVGAVWGVNLIALYLAHYWGPNYGLVAPYLMLVNALAHIGTVARTGGYNPGLATGFLIFVPLSLMTLWVVPATFLQHACGLGISVILHALIAALAHWRAGKSVQERPIKQVMGAPSEMRNLTVEEAYQAMFNMLERYYARAASDDIGGLLGDMSLLEDGTSADPAMMSEWVDCVAAARQGRGDAKMYLKRPEQKP